ncbi:MAG: hypothetical protein WC470_02575 [Candidatus Paceibacterota bacterium]
MCDRKSFQPARQTETKPAPFGWGENYVDEIRQVKPNEQER